MAIRTTDDVNYSNIATAIREKLGIEMPSPSDYYLPSEMANKIRDIPKGAEWVSSIIRAREMFLEDTTLKGFGYSPEFSSLVIAEKMLCAAYGWEEDIDLDLPECTNAKQMLMATGCPNKQSHPTPVSGFNVKLNLPKATDITEICFERDYEWPAIKNVELTTSSSLKYMQSAFGGCELMESCSVSNTSAVGVDNGNQWSQVFLNCRSLTDLSELNVKYAGNIDKMFSGCKALESITVTNDEIGYTTACYRAVEAFKNCISLENIPIVNLYDLNNVGLSDRLTNMYYGCTSLRSDSSLDKVLQTCLTVRGYNPSYKTLYHLGFRNESTGYSVDGTSYPGHATSVWTSLTHYQDFLDAGWSIGYTD